MRPRCEEEGVEAITGKGGGSGVEMLVAVQISTKARFPTSRLPRYKYQVQTGQYKVAVVLVLAQ